MKRIKCRWYEVASSASFKEIINKIKDSKYYENSDFGFETYEIKNDFANFKFIEKIQTKDVHIDPFGNQVVNSYVSYIMFFVSFKKISEHQIVMKITNGPISLRNLISALNRLTLFGFTITKLRLDVNSMYDWIAENKKIDRFIVAKASAKNIQVGDGCFASCEFSSASNALDELKCFLVDKKYIVDRICMNLRVNNFSAYLEVAESGTVTCAEKIEEMLNEFIFNQMLMFR